MTTRPGQVPLDEAYARNLDDTDPLASYRGRFRMPRRPDGATAVYLAGHSLGAQPVDAGDALDAELEAWASLGVDAWFEGDRAWLAVDGPIRESTALLVGAMPGEIATMSSLTIDLHLLITSFYRPAGARRAILIDAPTFPSDRYAVESQLRLHGADPAADLIVVAPRTGEGVVRPDDIEGAVHEHRDRLAMALLGGVNYATGQWHDIGRLTAAAHEAGAIAGWDLAHAVGNVPLALHDADVDFAAWCTYKYLNSGPGGPGQIFVHERHVRRPPSERLEGWWGNATATRFEMSEVFRPADGAEAWRVSTPSILAFAPLRVSLAILAAAGLPALRTKSVALTGYMEALLLALVPDLRLLTPRDPGQRGAQLSVRVPDASGTVGSLQARGVIADHREPDIIRMAPVPLYNSFHDAWVAVRALTEPG